MRKNIIKRSASPESDEHGTPKWLYDVLNDEFRFSLDVCASLKNYKHSYFYSVDDNGLTQNWGPRNFCNPPYSNILPWYEKAYKEVVEWQATTVFVTKYDPSTKHGKFASEYMDEIRIVEHRIAFEGSEHTANFPSAIMVMRPRLYTRKTDAKIYYVNYRELIPK